MLNEKGSYRKFSLIICIIFFALLSFAFSGSATPYEEWRKGFNTDNDEVFRDVKQTIDGGYIITGQFGSSSNSDALLIKVDKDGSKEWTKTYGGSEDDGAISILQRDDGYILLGWTDSYGVGGSDVWLIKTNKNGEQVWSRTFGGINTDEALSIQKASDNGFIITSYTISGSPKTWVIKTDKDGYLQWNKSFDGRFNDVKPTLDDGYILAGFDYYNTFVVKGAGRVYSGANASLIKIDAYGNEQWNRKIGKEGYTDNVFVQQTSDNGYALIGEGWFFKTDGNGNEQWNRTLGSTKMDDINSLVGTLDGGYIIAGATKSNDGNDDQDARLIKIDSSGNEVWNKTLGRSTNPDTATSVFQTSDGGYIVSAVELGAFVTQESRIIEMKRGRDSWLIKVGNKGLDPSIPAVKATEIKRTPESTPIEIKNSTEVKNSPISTLTENNKSVEKSPGFEILELVFSIAISFILLRKNV